MINHANKPMPNKFYENFIILPSMNNILHIAARLNNYELIPEMVKTISYFPNSEGLTPFGIALE